MAKLTLCAVVIYCLVGYISAGSIPKEFQDLAPEARETCLGQSATTIDLIERAEVGDFADDEKLKCYMKCLFQRFGVINAKGVDFKQFIRIAPAEWKDAAKMVAETCKDIKPAKAGDKCDLAYQLNMCWFKTAPDQHFIM